jgi:alpha-amylase/alpha-mannosidase (GH57 family)
VGDDQEIARATAGPELFFPPVTTLCFLWHMHQPFYKDLWTGEYRLPWTRLHALKDYAGMVSILGEFPRVRQTFNLVPSMIAQIEEYAAGTASDPFLTCATIAAEDMTEPQRQFALQYLFQANMDRMIKRYPRYLELYEKRARREEFWHVDMRDLQVLSQIAWWDEDRLAHDPELQDLVARGRQFSHADQEMVARKQREALGAVLPVYRDFAARGQIEISTTPFYHPILPLLCDSDIGAKSHPGLPLPTRFRYPQDAREQLCRSRSYVREKLGVTPVGLWPSEGSVSDEALAIAADCGFTWTASDNGVLAGTLGRTAGVQETYAAYLWRQHGRDMRLLFRDHFLSDLIGFTYSRMGAAEAAEHFLTQIRENADLLRGDALVPVILDGENAWEWYAANGRPFLRELYARISDDPKMDAVTVSEALQRFEPRASFESRTLGVIFPGSWINTNFDIWIGAQEDNRAWELLLDARRVYDAATSASEDARKLAYEELLIAEGSDWFWWYGPEHDSVNRGEFDQLYRDHLSNVYRALGIPPPEALSQSLLTVTQQGELHELPANPIQAVLDGEVTSYFEWMGAGHYRADPRSGAMHGSRDLQEMLYGADETSVYVRVDAATDAELAIEFEDAVAETEIARGKIVELRAPRRGKRFRVVARRGAIQVATLPLNGWIDLSDSKN